MWISFPGQGRHIHGYQIQIKLRKIPLEMTRSNIKYSEFFSCFCTGSLIRTANGDVPIEQLEIGSPILTAEGTSAMIRWVGTSKIPCVGYLEKPNLWPVRIERNALGPNMPDKTLYVSAQHRMLLQSTAALSLYGVGEVLVPAIKLIFINGIQQTDQIARDIYFHHILLDDHRIIYANNAKTESMLLGSVAVKMLPSESIDEIHVFFPEINLRANNIIAPARPVIEREKDIKVLFDKNSQYKGTSFNVHPHSSD